MTIEIICTSLNLEKPQWHDYSKNYNVVNDTKTVVNCKRDNATDAGEQMSYLLKGYLPKAKDLKHLKRTDTQISSNSKFIPREFGLLSQLLASGGLG